MTLLKSLHGIPEPAFPIPRGVVLADEARIARRRFYPATVLLTTYSLTVIGVAAAHRLAATSAYVVMGVMAWTLIEYLVHRYVLHGRFQDGPGIMRRGLHRLFDHLHSEHHLRPWDGRHINGHLSAVPFAALFALVSFASPYYTGPVFVAAVLQCYVIEEWIHYATHFSRWRSPYMQYIRHHHWRHHARAGSRHAFGLTSGVWDVLYGTTVAPRKRRASQELTWSPLGGGPSASING